MKKVLLSVVALMSLATATLAQTVPNYVPANGLVGWYPFSGNANDASGNGNNGTVNGPVLTSDRFGNSNAAYSYDGINDYFTAQQNLTSYSFSFWFNALILSGSPNCNLYNYENTYSELLTANGSIYARAQYTTAPHSHVITNYIPTLNNWHHMVVNFDAVTKQIEIFVDNTNHFVGTLNATGGAYYSANNNNTVYFGGVSLYSISYFSGKMDDIGIWNRTLTQQEVTNLYNANICYDHVTVTDTLIISTNMVGFNPVTYQNTIKVWPNPAHDHITIDNGNIANLNGYQIKISNVLGQQVFQSAINQQQFYINLSTWNGNGTYYINLINPQGVTVETRVIVMQ
jgi:hypothetical protein